MLLRDEETDDVDGAPSRGAGGRTRVVGGRDDAGARAGARLPGAGRPDDGVGRHRGDTARRDHPPDCVARPRPQRA